MPAETISLIIAEKIKLRNSWGETDGGRAGRTGCPDSLVPAGSDRGKSTCRCRPVTVRSTQIPTESCPNSCSKGCYGCCLVGLVSEEVAAARAGFVTSLPSISETAFVPNGVLLLLGGSYDSRYIAEIEFQSFLGEPGTGVEGRSMRP